MQLGVPPELIPVCAAAVVMTGLIGAATCQRLLNLGGFSDPITSGLSTAGAPRLRWPEPVPDASGDASAKARAWAVPPGCGSWTEWRWGR